ncbi:MAG: helix-turn-helix domain-containing protein [Planctomycetes bacterium]|nr:helix-turn-helix domain-containing protein [Planctomycetota bacterium]MBI3845117.1 helix-turn-helix domain-containing protein [Planctomycetota bacterium]
MTSSRATYAYDESGLQGVFLEDIEIRRCRACKTSEAVIPRMEELHRVMAHTIAGKRPRLSPEEIRFLRTHLGWTQRAFATRFGVSVERVSRWENGHPISRTAERLLRVLILTRRSNGAFSAEMLTKLAADPSRRNGRMNIKRVPVNRIAKWRVERA